MEQSDRGASRGPESREHPRSNAAWTFLSNHARVLAALAEDPQIRLRDVATEVGITERAAQSIVADLAEAGYVTRTRVGRRNRYEVHRDAAIHDGHHHVTVGGLLDFLHEKVTVATRAFRAEDALNSNGARSN